MQQNNSRFEQKVSEVLVYGADGSLKHTFVSSFMSSILIRRENGRIYIVEPGVFSDRVYSPGIYESIEIRE